MAAALTPRQARFVQEYLVDQIGAQAARRAGYAAKTAKSVETQAARLLANVGVRAAIDAALQKRAEKYKITTDKVIRQLARIALANPRDYVDEAGEALDLRKLTGDQAMAINSFEIEDVVDRHTGQVRRRTKAKLADRNVALGTLSKCLGMQTDRHVIEGSLEYRIKAMTPAERIERVRQLREKAERVYLPQYIEMTQANGSPVTDTTVVPADGDDEVAGDRVVVEPGHPEPLNRALGSRHDDHGDDDHHVDPRRAARDEILGPVDADQTSGWQMWPGHNTRR